VRSLVLPALVGSLFIAACGQAFAQAQRSHDSGYIIGEPIRHKNLTIFPVLSKVEQKVDRYITLDEGLRAGTVQVIEVGATPSDASQVASTAQQRRGIQGLNSPGQQTTVVQGEPQHANAPAQSAQVNFRPSPNAGNQVNQLMVVNKSGKPLYLMPGEVIVGGSQDRTIGNEMTIAPTAKPVPIDVFCVEHGRWHARGNDESASLYVALEATDTLKAKALAVQALQGGFARTAAPLGKAARVAVQSEKSQQAVWDNVAKNNAALRVDSESGTFTRSYADKRVQSELEPYVAELTARVSGQNRVVGAIVAINGKIESMDVFESTPLFRELWPKLLKSYALDSVCTVADAKAPAKDSKAAKTSPPAKESTVADASAFLNKVLQGTVRDKQIKAGLVITHRETDGAKSYSAAGMGGAPIHAAGFAP